MGLLITYPVLVIAETGERVTDVTQTEVVVQYEEPIGPTQLVIEEDTVPPYVSDPQSTLIHICSCESGNGKYGTPQQFEPDGVTPLVGKLTPAIYGQDIGMCQINTKHHLETATSLGYDIYTAEGNWGYAMYLLEIQGTQPWEASRSCWQ